MLRFLSLVVVLALAANTFALIAETMPEKLTVYENDNVDFDFDALQYRRKASNEMEVEDMRDDEFDDEVCDESGRPREPSSLEINAVYEKQKESVASQAKAAGIDLSTVSLRVPSPFALYTDKLIWKPQLKCCPRKYNYGCAQASQRMPCFVNYNNNLREWCCPLWPGVYTARCLCDKCHIQTSTCIHSGRCLKRYTRKSFLAVCYRGGWGHLRFFNKWIPTSCYCSVRKYPYIAAADQVSAQHCPK